jgi:hypothetical protein
MTYGDHIPMFQRELERLGRPTMALTIDAVIGALARQGSAEADAACRVYAATLEWPPVADSVRLELCLRLTCALWWLDIARDENPEGETGSELLESVLIEYWRDVGRVDWIHDRFVQHWAEEHFPGSTGAPD